MLAIKDILRLKAAAVWLSRIGHCRGFGIQSPTDYWFVRYVINEHWPYYQYEMLGQDDDWLTQKVGRLLFRVANWRQPTVIDSGIYQEYLKAGCSKADLRNQEDMEAGKQGDLVVMSLDDDCWSRLTYIYNKVKADSVLVITDVFRARGLWRKVVADERSVITFDLYYCGVVMFDKKRRKQNYIINF